MEKMNEDFNLDCNSNCVNINNNKIKNYIRDISNIYFLPENRLKNYDKIIIKCVDLLTFKQIFEKLSDKLHDITEYPYQYIIYKYFKLTLFLFFKKKNNSFHKYLQEMYDEDFVILMDYEFNIEKEYENFHRIYYGFIELLNIIDPFTNTLKFFNTKGQIVEIINNSCVDIIKILIFIFEEVNNGSEICKDFMYKIYNKELNKKIKERLVEFFDKEKNFITMYRLIEIFDYCNK